MPPVGTLPRTQRSETFLSPNIAVERVAFLLHTGEVQGSNLGSEMIFCLKLLWFYSAPKGKCRDGTSI